MAALDTLILGPFVFTDFAVPDRMPFGGKQQLVIHKLPGGTRVIDAMGPDDHDRTWSGILWGETAESDAMMLDQMRRNGDELAFSWGMESRTAVISEFKPEVEKFQCIHYTVTIVLTDDSGSATGGGIGGLTSMIMGDLGAVMSRLS